MSTILFLVLRRMRAPLLALAFCYSVAILGLVLIPGMDDQGNPWRMNFFHAFYFVSFMGTTIGFGEIPYPFTDAQRMWALASIYLTVVAWVYAIGALLTLVQDEALRQAFRERRFARRVRALREPFYLVCGYGDTGSALVGTLGERMIRSVVVDIRQERIHILRLTNHSVFVPGLCADAARPEYLREAGVSHPYCAGVVALTNRDQVNLHVAITAKMLNPQVKVICRAESHHVGANMASFGTDHIIDPFDAFADQLGRSVRAPSQHRLRRWLSQRVPAALPKLLDPPRGHWILCGYGRFGKAVHEQLCAEGIPVQVVEELPEERGAPDGFVRGRGTEAHTLREAGVENAVAVVAGTDDDSDNLSIIMTARDLAPELFVVLRQNQQFNEPIFEAARADLVMQGSQVIARTIWVLLTIPMLQDFLVLANEESDEWARDLIETLSDRLDDDTAELWQTRIDSNDAYGVIRALEHDAEVRLGHLLRDHHDRDQKVRASALMLVRGRERTLLPAEDEVLRPGDRLLFMGARGVQSQMAWTLQNVVALTYVLTGEALPRTYIWRWLHRHLHRSAPRTEGATNET